MNKSPDIIGIGAINVDQIVLLPSFPQENKKIHVDRFYQYIGGTVPTALVMAHALGNDVEFYGTVGDDQPGQFIVLAMAQYGIDIRTITVQKGKISAFSQVWINAANGSRTIARSQGTLELLKPNFTDKTFEGVKILHLDAKEVDASLVGAKMAKEKGVTVTFDIGSPKPRIDEIVAVSDIVFVPKQYLIDRYQRDDLVVGAETLRKDGPSIVIATDGEHGLAVATKDGSFTKPSFSVKTIDSNGAGDVFAGTFMNAYIEKKSLEECVVFAQAAAAIKCTRLGKDKLPTKEEIEEFLKNH